MRRLISFAILCLLPSASFACLWDYDTLKQERSRFPDTLEIITGKFLRHSPEFYEWRIKDRLEKLKRDPKNAAYHDDLAVAYAKTGQYAKAIATMEALERIVPGRYETYSNLGTFHFLAGDIAKALPIIDKALAINPDAHFGREKYQRWLGEYILARRPVDGKVVLPLRLDSQPLEDRRPRDFEMFVGEKYGNRLEITAEHRDQAIRGILGMMRFADHTNPVLLETLGDLLSDAYRPSDGKRLAARAYLAASYVVADPAARTAYLNRAKFVLHLQTRHPATQEPLPLEELEVRFRDELKDSEQWYAELKAKELGWISSGANPETEFDKLYDREPRIDDEPTDTITRPWYQVHKSELIGWGLTGGIILVLAVAGLCYWRFVRRD
jgi:tetratricopeptide (TPR) repeat protein